MSFEKFVSMLLIGGIAGWVSGLITKGKGFGLAGNIVVGVIGAFLGGFIFGLLQIHTTGAVGQLLFAVAGALLFLYLLKFVKR